MSKRSFNLLKVFGVEENESKFALNDNRFQEY